jgi:voltage-gated potassium channel
MAMLALLGVAALGTVGYIYLEGWSFFDAFYMTVITLATIGYGEVKPLSPAGRLFTVGLIVAGATAAAYIAGAFTQLVVDERLSGMVGRKRMERELAHLSDHTIICGWGRIGRGIAAEFRRKNAPYVVIEMDDKKCREFAEEGMLHVRGDASDDAVLQAARVTHARALVAVAPRDADNIFITLSARALNPNLYIVARSVYEQDAHKLEIAGADRVLSPYVIGAQRIAASVFNPGVVDFLDEEVHVEHIEWDLVEVPVTARASFVGKTLRDSEIRQRTGCTILAVKETPADRFQSNPQPELVLREGALLVALGTADQLRRLETLAKLTPADRRPMRKPAAGGS